MDAPEFYRLTGPTEWAEPPERFSFSSLKLMGVCLRRWQLLTSRHGDLARYPERPVEAAIVGVIVHEILSRLFRAMALVGYPALGTEAFRAAVARVDILGTARAELAEALRRAAENPRAQGFQLQATARDVYNKVAQGFRNEYASVGAGGQAPAPPLSSGPMAATAPVAGRRELLERQGLLSEEEVRHPRLPVRGFIDLLVRRDGRTVVLDFKTGAAHPEHREQLLVYALMWWRSTDDLPVTIELRYGARVESWPVSAAELDRVERELDAKIARHLGGMATRPAAASVGLHCTGCGVRQLCDDYWVSSGGAGMVQGEGERADLAVTVQSAVTKTGFIGHDRSGQEIAVVFDEEVALMYGPFAERERLRILGAFRESGLAAFRLTRATEVFHIG
jgi:hypothetical protein